MSKMKQCKCKQCGKEFVASHKRKHCSKHCSLKYGYKKRSANKVHCIHCKVERSVPRARLGVNCRCRRGGKPIRLSCLFCGCDVVKSRQHVARNDGKAYCSVDCYDDYRKTQTAWKRQLKRQQKNAVESGGIKCCEWCQSMFVGDRRTCGADGCKMPYEPKRPERDVICEWCGVAAVKPAGIKGDYCCSEHSKRHSAKKAKKRRKNRLKTDIQFAEKERAKKAVRRKRRRAILKGVETESIDSDAVYRRDKWECSYCYQPIKKYPDNPGVMQDEATIDHVVPISKGGSHKYENIVAACRYCNTSKGDRLLPTTAPSARRL